MDYIEKWEQIGLSDNFVFQKVMEDNELCKEVLERILNVKLLKVQTIATEKTIQDTYKSKGIRVDAYVADEQGTVFNVEAQTSDIKDILPKRIRYYQSTIDLNLLLQGSDYSELKDVYIIFICNFDPIGLEYSQYRFKTISQDDHSIVLEDGRTIILLYSYGKDKIVNQGLRNLLDLFNGTKVEGDELVSKIDSKIRDIKERKECRMEWIRRQCDMQDERRMGKAEGLAEGLAEGEAKGKTETKIEDVTNLIKQGKLSLVDISDALGCPLEKVQELAERLKTKN